MTDRSRSLRSQDGFTLIELLVTLSALLVILFATLTTFDSFTSSSDANSRLTAAEDAARTQLDQLTAQIRNATPVGTQTAALTRPTTGGAVNDIIFGTYGTSNGTTQSFIRYCVDTTTRSLVVEQPVGTAQSDPGTTACPSSWPHTSLLTGLVANTASNPLFTVDSAGRAVGINLQIDAGRNGSNRTRTIRTAAYLRSASGRAPNLSASDITAPCSTQNGKKVALLSLGAGVGGGDPLNASYSIAGVPIGSGSVKVAADTPVNVLVTVTNILGLQQLLTKTVTC